MVTVMLLVAGALGTVLKRPSKELEKIKTQMKNLSHPEDGYFFKNWNVY